MAVKFEALQETCLGTKGTVIDFGYISILNVGRFEAEIVEIADAFILAYIRDGFSIVDGSDRTAFHFAVEHAVHHHRLKVGGSGGDIVVAHYTSYRTTSGNIGITEAVDDSRTAVKQTHNTTYIVTASNRTTRRGNLIVTIFVFFYSAICGQYTTIINTGITRCFATDGTNIRSATDADIVKNNVTLPNPGANVGYKDYSEYYPDGTVWKVRDKSDAETKDKRLASSYVYGTGVATVNVFGGLVHRVFGGSNTKGNVRQTAVTMLEDASGCPFKVDEAYGGGKSAPMDAEAKLLMACIPGLNAVYGGAEDADIHGDVELTITNGTFDRVFGGNNKSGQINGSITVNIEEVGCRPIIIGELYGGGNLAPYSIYGYNTDGTPKESGANPSDDPEVNVKSFTSIGTVYGGGYGEQAVMVGSPTVNINEVADP